MQNRHNSTLTILSLRGDKGNLQSDENAVLKHVMVRSEKLLSKFKCQQRKERAWQQSKIGK